LRKRLDEAVNRANKADADLQGQRTDLEKRIATLEGMLRKAQQDLSSAKSDRDNARLAAEKLADNNKQMNGRLSASQDAAQQLEKDLRDQRAATDKARSDLNDAIAANTAQGDALAKGQQQVQTLTQEVQRAQMALADAEKRVGQNQSGLDKERAIGDQLRVDLEAAVRTGRAMEVERWWWAATAALLALAVGASVGRRLWPVKTSGVAVSASVSLGDWSLRVLPSSERRSLSFRVSTSLIPVHSQVQLATPPLVETRQPTGSGERHE
jgi:predicted  nucleic acid-binding Zn-ribbon protein